MALTQIKLGGLAANSVDSDAYVDGSIDLAHLSADSVDSTQYVDGSIDNAHLADDAADSDEIAAGAIDLAHMSVNSIDSDQYVDGSIDNAHLADNAADTAEIADNAITLAKMAGGTDGNVISYDASGDPVAIATGNDGQVLTSTGAGSPPAFEALPGTTSIEMFYPAAKDGQTTTGYGYYRPPPTIDNAEAAIHTVTAPKNFTSVSAMYVWWFKTQDTSGGLNLTCSWNMGGDKEAYNNVGQNDVELTEADAGENFSSGIINRSEFGQDITVDTQVAAGDAFGLGIASTGDDDTHVLGISVVWVF